MSPFVESAFQHALYYHHYYYPGTGELVTEGVGVRRSPLLLFILLGLWGVVLRWVLVFGIIFLDIVLLPLFPSAYRLGIPHTSVSVLLF